jgi:hypothetical protein
MEISHLGFTFLTFKFEISLSIAENSGSSNREGIENQPHGVAIPTLKTWSSGPGFFAGVM